MTDNPRLAAPGHFATAMRSQSPRPGSAMSNKRSSLPRAVSPAATASTSRDVSSRLSTGSQYGDEGSPAPLGSEQRPRPPREPAHRDEIVHKKRRTTTTQRPRTTGGFLLPDARPDANARLGALNQDADPRRSRLNGEIRRGKTPMPINRSTPSPTAGLGLDTATTADEVLDANANDSDISRLMTDTRQDGALKATRSRASRIPSPSPRPSPEPLDMDSTQIVNMALNLSESRRAAARRNISAPVPPRLAPLPDTLGVGSLKQHLHQQRRTSRTISPRPDKNALSSPRQPSFSSSPRIGSSSLQHAYEPEGPYTYQFSSSTLNRAQKAKEHLELMAQYRRLLQIAPPLGQQPSSHEHALSSSPASAGTHDAPGGFPGQRQASVGRPYNPLQYIRNRKVRARERKPIDGEAQGFSDIPRVTDWVDQVAVSTPLSGSSKIPYFPGAHEHVNNASQIPRPVASTGKLKRPRLDWSFEPADMLADIYWLEQDDNRSLIEDRNYAKIFASKVEKQQRPWSAQASDSFKAGKMSPSLETSRNGGRTSLPLDSGINRAGTDGSRSSARDRARQKLHGIKGTHKHSNSQHGYHDFLRLGRGAPSDTSDSDTDRRKRERSGTLTASSRDLLEKQMRDMLAQEAAERQKSMTLDSVPETPLSPEEARDSASPAKQNSTTTQTGHVRAESYTGAQSTHFTDRWPFLHQSSARGSLDIPSNSKRSSVDHSISQPTSPDGFHSRRGSAFIASGSEMSPSNSRPVSPSRKPLAKVRNLFRDKSRDRTEDKENKGRASIDQIRDGPIFPPMDAKLMRAAGDDRSPSPLSQKLPSRSTGDSHKSHRSMGSVKLRGDEVFPFKNIIKGGVKLDSIVRGGVSKVTDMIWKKDSDVSSSSSSSSEESDDEQPKRGRQAKLMVASRDSSRPREKHFLDVMPHFKSTSESNEGRSTLGVTEAPEAGFLSPTSLGKGRKSTRFDMLKPPRLNVPSSPAGVSRISEEMMSADLGQLDESDSADGKTQRGHDDDHAAYGNSARDLQNVLAGVPHALDNNRKRHHSNSVSKRDSGRHWSITDRDATPRQSQLSRSELVGVRALILSSGIKAMEISRRANEPHPLFAIGSRGPGIPWSNVCVFVPGEAIKLLAPQLELYPTTARVLLDSIDTSTKSFQEAATQLTTEIVPALQHRIDELHLRIATGLIKTTQETADDADEVSRDLVHNQRLKVQHVVEAMEKMSRSRRRRFRWFRRAVWLVVEWVLVASMWWLWAAFVVFRSVFFVTRGAWGAVRWLLWL
ncbi:septal pore-associated protein [Microdochium nivale]|nr:septal pore-associated protein [Microdochium nivale]